jgi:hypothetical protein
MNIIYFLIVFLILVVTAIVLNEEIRVSKVLNNIITRGLIILGVVYACMLKDFPLAILLSILFVVLTNDHLKTEKFDGGSEETETDMKIDITDSTNKQKCLAKCVISVDDDDTSKCMEFCNNSCFVKCTSNYKNSTFFECQDMCE